MLDRAIQDLRFAFRQLLRHRSFSALLVLTITVAIGANVAIFSVLEGIVLRPLPYADADRLLAVWERPEGEEWHQPFTGPDYFDVREQANTLEEFGVITLQWRNLAGGGDPVRVQAALCTASLLEVLGVQPVLGRLFSEEEETEGNHRVVILSHGLWQSQFGGSADVLGEAIVVNGEPHEIVGVMPASFRFPTPWGGRDATRIALPLVLPTDGSGRGSHWLGAYGRMADRVTPEEVAAELAVIAGRLSEAYPNTNAQTRMWVEPIMTRTLGSIRSVLVFMLVIVGLVLVVACANVASMLLARGLNRAPEFAIRASMGAGRSGLVRQLVTESLLLAAVGGGAGITLAYFGVEALQAVIPDSVPRTSAIGVNVKVLGFAALVTILTGLLVGLAPALLASRTNLAEVIKNGRASRGGGRSRFLSGLVTAQLGVGFVLVNAAFVLSASYGNVLNQTRNYDTDEVLITSISLGGPAYEEAPQRRAFWEDLVTRVRARPDVVQAGVSNKVPLRGGSNGGILVRDQVFDPNYQQYLVEYTFVDDGYHEAMGIPLLAGRGFDQRDLDASAAMAADDSAMVEVPLIINRALAREAWPDAEALGELVRPNSADPSWVGRVVGIVEDVRQWGPERDAIPEMYFPHTSELWGPIWGYLVVRTAGDPQLLTTPVREMVGQLDSSIPTAEPITMARILEDSTGSRRFSMVLVALFAATALLLIVAGTYGVMSYGVSQRTHEIGVRMTLGARRMRVVGLFAKRVGAVLVAGIGIGILGAWAASRLIGSMVYGISPLSPAHMAAAGLVMAVVALAATMVPVRRATAVDPLEALSAE